MIKIFDEYSVSSLKPKYFDDASVNFVMQYLNINENELFWLYYEIRNIIGYYYATKESNCKKHYLLFHRLDPHWEKHAFKFSKKELITVTRETMGAGHSYHVSVPIEITKHYYKDFYYGIFECKECGEKLFYISKNDNPCDQDGIMIRLLKDSYEVIDNYQFIDLSNIESDLYIYHDYKKEDIDAYISEIISQCNTNEELIECVSSRQKEIKDRIEKCPKLIKRKEKLDDFSEWLS